ncbi:RpiB/LacA/LacB family sugar-phosphate isomerase [Microbacterium halotolerans]|uniref:RpiB/LacA/LacB family sugar-phosphate isomerase n=1 Tax=Microbacterium halotolerans TaxID=246613 RepID=UPI000E6A9599|nr:RpiB/LacA/LacB family sugar-phosphate isomerase [Microbacterium halotolerans]
MSDSEDRRVVLGADFAGFSLKEAVKSHLIERGWQVDDLTPTLDEADMYHRVGFLIGAQISEGRYEKALAFCGSGMGIHVAASKCPHVHAAVCETVQSALRAATANNCNVLAMGAFYVAPRLGRAMADAFLEHSLGDGYEEWEGFREYHQIGYDECERFDYAAYRDNGFRVVEPREAVLGPEPRGLAF